MLYDIAFLIFSLFYLPTLIFKGKLHADFGERFARYSEEKRRSLKACEGGIWIEAVSVGEVAVCRSLIEGLKARFPGKKIVFSTVTKTGNELARKLYSGDAVIIYFPLDLSWIARRSVSLIAPSLYIMVETEIWPNIIKELSSRSVPCVLVNGRISDRSFGRYRLVKPFLSGTLKKIGLFCMQSLPDAGRIKALGAPDVNIRVTGNMKFDADVRADTVKAEEAKNKMGLSGGGRLLVAGSTHPGEETVILDVFARLSVEFPDLKLLIAPRHIDRAGDVGRIIARHGFTPIRLSTLGPRQNGNGGPQVYLLDTIGQLRDIYSIATLVFVGGSLVPHGGQNPIEPAVFGKPVIFGPHMFNFREITRVFVDNDAAMLVKNDEGLLAAIKALLTDPKLCSNMGKNAAAAIIEKRGVTNRNIEEICATLSIR
jgi:3-deoxy-D-manno-octulosonic-acid transferase